jgi:hypothetical protein
MIVKDSISLVPEINKILNYSLDPSRFRVRFEGLYKKNETGYKAYGKMITIDPLSKVDDYVYIYLNFTCFLASNSCIIDGCVPFENEKKYARLYFPIENKDYHNLMVKINGF